LQDSNFNRFVEVGRGASFLSLSKSSQNLTSLTVVFLKSGPSAGKIAVIAEIIDHNRVRDLALSTDPLN